MNIIFCGGSGEIGASCILLQLDGKNILLDSGIRMNAPDPLPDFRIIQENGGVDAIFISHGHMDHVGSLPVISREFPQAPIYMTHATKDITKVLLYDSLKIMNSRESEIPVYAEDHVEKMLDRIICYSFQYTFTPFDDRDIKVDFYMAGHIAGASAIYIQGREGSIFYSGDFSVTPQQSLPGISIPALRPDVMITEATYGDKLHANRSIEEERLVDIVRQVVERGGKILIPAFAVGRAQEIILVLKRAISKKQLPEVPIYIDGMVKDICRIYKLNPNYLKPNLAKKIWREKEIFYTDYIQPVADNEMRRKIVEDKESCCIISSSGMLTGGPSLFYAEHIIKDEKNYIAITGYQDEESPGRHLLDLLEQPPETERLLTLGDRKLPILCQFGKYNLSAHADKGEILGVISKLAPKKLFLLHGNEDILFNMGKELQSKISGKIYIPKNGQQYNLYFDNPRKQLKKLTLSTLDKGSWPEKGDFKELREYLYSFNKTSGYTAEELLYLWSGRQDFDEARVLQCMSMLKDSMYFEPDKYRPFLFHPVTEEALIEDKETVMEVNEMLSFAERFFPEEAGLYKKGARFEQKIALLYFHFPAVALKKFENLIKEFEQITGWKAETNTQHNQVAVETLLSKMLGEERNLIQKIAFHPLDNIIKASLAKKPSCIEKLEKEFIEITGIPIVLDYPGRIQTESQVYKSLEIHVDLKDKEPMEQNEAFNLIQQAFSPAPHSLYKKSLKADENGKYIELSFISPIVGEKYISWIQDLSKETGWRIKINPIPNQKEIIQAAITLLHRHDIVLKKNPSILQIEKKARVKLTQSPDAQIWESIQNKFNEMTGFQLEYVL